MLPWCPLSPSGLVTDVSCRAVQCVSGAVAVSHDLNSLVLHNCIDVVTVNAMVTYALLEQQWCHLTPPLICCCQLSRGSVVVCCSTGAKCSSPLYSPLVDHITIWTHCHCPLLLLTYQGVYAQVAKRHVVFSENNCSTFLVPSYVDENMHIVWGQNSTLRP